MDTVAGTLAGYGGWERTWKTSFFSSTCLEENGRK